MTKNKKDIAFDITKYALLIVIAVIISLAITYFIIVLVVFVTCMLNGYSFDWNVCNFIMRFLFPIEAIF